MHAIQYIDKSKAYSWKRKYFIRPSFPFTGTKVSPISSKHGPSAHKRARAPATAAMNESIIRILKNSLAKSTQKSYHNAFKHFLRFHDTYYTGQAMLPISTHKLAQFISVCHDLGLQPNSITSMVSALSYIHRLYDFPNPAHTFLIQKMLYSIRKQRGSEQRLGFTLNLLQKLIQSLSLITHDTYITLLLRTMFLLAFYALLRVSEITTTSNGSANIINRENVKFSYKNGKVIKASLKLMNYKHSKGQTSTIISAELKIGYSVRLEF